MPTLETVPQTVTHTPGPWTLTVGPVTPGGAAPIAYVTAETGHREVAVLYCDVARAQHLANAHLVAAAPELLDALNGMVGLIQLLPDRDQRESLQRNHRYVEACAVLAQAEGGR